MFLTDKIFWSDATERAIKTAAQTLITLWLTSDAVFNILTVDWKSALGVSAGAALLSVLSSIASAQVRNRGTASLTVNPPVSDADGIGK